MADITYKDVRNNEEFKTYVKLSNELLGVLGYTDHSSAHTVKVGETAADILKRFGYSEKEIDLAKITGYIHDIGNMVNRVEHAQTGALIAFQILTKMNMSPCDIGVIVGAIGNHDEDAGLPVSPVSAAIIIADKTDVRRSRVRNTDFVSFDIHDRVNYAVVESRLETDAEEKMIMLNMKIDTQICSVMEYFQIFLTRMLLCKRAAEFLGASFKLRINETILL